MRDLGSILERESRTVEAPEPSMDRLIRRRDRKRRNERIAAAAAGLVVAVAGIGLVVLAMRFGHTTQPASGGSPPPEGAGDGGWVGLVLPTVAIWIAVAVLGLTMLAIVRLRSGPAHAVASRPTSGAQAAPGHGPAADTGTARSEGGNEMDGKSNVRTPQAQIPGVPAERPRGVEERKGPGGPWLVLAVIVALLVGLGGGYALREAVQPTKTKTVAPPAYTTSRDVQARVTFDGSTCAYSGPAEVAAGTRIAFDYTAVETVESAMVVIRLLPGMTYEDMVQVATRDADNPPSWAVPNWESEPTGAPHQSLTMSLDEDVWAIFCLTNPETTNDVVMGTMIRAVGG